MPSTKTRVWLPSAPRMRTWVKVPMVPERLTATPGMSRSTSETMRTWRSSSCSPVIMVTAEPASRAGKGTRLAETTTSG